MNTIEEILKSKKRNQTEETIYETYKRVICVECNNKHNDKDLCRITRTIDNKAKCFNYDRCMRNNCKTCKNNQKCNKQN